MNEQMDTIVVTNIDSEKFEKLYSEHGELLSCPCSTITTLYETFVTNKIRFHPVCSSLFIRQEWIDGLYLSNRSSYNTADFRTVASSQFQLLSSLCSLSQDIGRENEITVNNNKFVTMFLLPESKAYSDVTATVQLLKTSVSTRIVSFINYFRFITQGNNFVTALQTDVKSSVIVTTTSELISPSSNDDTNNESEQGVSCRNTLSSIPAVIYETTGYATLINGFYIGCSSLEALLRSTLDCLYETDCLQLLNDHFPTLNQMNLNLTEDVLFLNGTNLTLYNHLVNLFIEEWTVTLNYSAYFQNCNPSVCTYTTKNAINYSYAINLFISLYGGLILILRFISSFLMKHLLNLKYQLATMSCRNYLRKCVQSMKLFILFKSPKNRTENDTKRRKIIKRVYLILLIISTTILLLFNSLRTQVVTISIANPSFNTYIDLETSSYSNTLRCPCSMMKIPHQKFLSFSPILHQVCSSDLITDRWLTILNQSATTYIFTDWRFGSYQQFHLLSKLCQLANETVTNAIDMFLLRSFIVSNMLTEVDFEKQMDNILTGFYQSTIFYFYHLIDVIDLHIQVDQPYMRTNGATIPTMITINTDGTTEQNLTNDSQSTEFILPENQIQNPYSISTECICSTNPNCQRLSIIIDASLTGLDEIFENTTASYIVSGSIVGCSEISSLLLSTLECFYSDSTCFPILMNYIKQTYIWNVEEPSWFDIHTLSYNSTSDHFYPNSSISVIVKNIMIEQWNPSYSYEHFYQLCSPTYCLYEKRIYANNIIGAVVILLSVLGGLSASLRFITPCIIAFIIRLSATITRKRKTKQQQNQPQPKVVQNRFVQSKSIVQKAIKSLYNALITLNIFSRHNFGSNTDQTIAKQLGQQTTRIYIIFLVISFVTSTVYIVSRKQILTKNFNQPSLNTYNQLMQDYGDQLICFCSSISSPYSKFIEIKPKFHEICSSSFTSNEIINNLDISLSSNISIYDSRDYRRLISSHLQYLIGLCRISIQSTNDSINQTLSTLFISKQLLSQYDFDEYINLLVKQTKFNAPDTLNSIFFLIRNINFGNSIVSTYGTNYRYIADLNIVNGVSYSYFKSKAEIYDNNCSCGVYLNCTSQAYFIDRNSSKQIPLTGLKIGCVPSESFLSSTLECFYDTLCVNTIREYTNYMYSLEPLSIITNQSLITMTIEELVKNLFTYEWITTKNYSAYYQQCLPLSCSYSYIQEFNLIYIISYLLGLQGGLRIVLQWICPKLIQFKEFIQKYRKKRSNAIHPQLEPKSDRIQHISACSNSVKIICMCIFVGILISVLVVFSIYTIRQKNNQTTAITTASMYKSSTTIESTDTTKIITTADSSSTRVPICQIRFESEPIALIESTYSSPSIFFGNFNNDERLDVGYVSESAYFDSNTSSLNSQLTVLLTNEDGTLGIPTTSLIPYIYGSMVSIIADFNNDNLSEIVLANGFSGSIYVLNGDGTGKFTEWIEIFVNDCIYISDILTADFNNDKYPDIFVLCQYPTKCIVFFGNDNETFEEKIIFDTLKVSNFYSIAITDLNSDNKLDMVAVNSSYRTVDVFIGDGNGSFQIQTTSFTGGGMDPANIAVGDFNEDTRQDVVVSYQGTAAIGLLFGYDNGTFGRKIKLNLKDDIITTPIIVSDFNNDAHLDIITITHIPYTINIYMGYGNGQFEMYTMFSTEYTIEFISMIAGDLNGDGYEDIAVSTEHGVQIFFNTGHCINGSMLFDQYTTET